MHEPYKKRKPSLSTEINIYREACRDLVARSKLHGCHKAILLKHIDSVNRYSYDTYIGEAALASSCGTSVRSVRRAMRAAIVAGLIERTSRGNQYNKHANHYVYKVQTPKEHRTLVTEHRTPMASAQDTSVLLTSEEHLINLTCTGNNGMEDKESGERAPAGPESEPKPKWTRPIVYGERPRTPEDSYELEQVREAGFVPRVWWRREQALQSS